MLRYKSNFDSNKNLNFNDTIQSYLNLENKFIYTFYLYIYA